MSKKLRTWLIVGLAALFAVAMPVSTGIVSTHNPVGVAKAATTEVRYTAYTTGYGWWDNTPAGSLDISNQIGRASCRERV